jgi:hypothetical protein
VNSSEAAAAAGIHGGTDVNCGSVYQNSIGAAVSSGLLSLADVAAAGTRFLKVVIATGLFDGAGLLVLLCGANTRPVSPSDTCCLHLQA